MKRMKDVPVHNHAEDFFNDDDVFQIDGPVQIGAAPTVDASTGTWGNSFDPNNMRITDMVVFKGDLYACGDKYIMRQRGGVWTIVRTETTYVYYTLCVAWNRLFVGKHGTTFGTDVKVYVDVTDDGDTWDNAYTSAAYGGGVGVYKLLLVNNIMYAGLLNYGVISSTDGYTWGSAGATTGTYRDLFVHNGSIYATTSTGRTVKKFNGVATWTTVYTSAYDTYFGYSWNGKAYIGLGGSCRIAYSADGVSWTEIVVVAIGAICFKFAEWNATLLVGTGAGKAYQSADGIVWTEFYDHTEPQSHSWVEFEGKLYVGCGNEASGTEGYIHVYTDATYDPAPPLTANGNFIIHGQLRPGDAPGADGDLLMSGGVTHPHWLARGETGQYVGGVTGGRPIYKTIPASDISGMTAAVLASFRADAVNHIITNLGEVVVCQGNVVMGG
jgi:hypothetical protein